mgnify:CR=1 FL=1
MFKRLFISFTILFGVFFIPSVVAAGTIVINEIMYDLPGTDDKHEWVEIKNISNSAVDLTRWKFFDGDGTTNHTLAISAERGGQGSLIIPAGGFAILSGNASTFLSDYAGFSGTVIDTVMNLGNTSDVLKILNADGQVVDEVSYAKEMGGAGDGYDLERVSDYSNQFCASQHLGGSAGLANVPNCFTPSPTSEASPEPTATPTNTPIPSATTVAVKITPTPISSAVTTEATSSPMPSANTIVSLNINEFIPNPEGSDEENEWIEIYNAGETEVNLTGWKLKDASNKGYNFTNEKIVGKGFLILTRSQTKITINNDTEVLSLISPQGEIASQIQYSGGSQEGYAFARYAKNDWRWTNILTPGKSNQFSEKQDKKDVAVEEDGDIVSSQSPEMASLSANEASSLRKIVFIALGTGFVFSIAVLILMKKFVTKENKL